MEKINLYKKLNLFSDHFNPKIIAELNSQQIKLVKFKGDFVWHSHANEDEMFYVLKGSFFMDLRDKTIELNEGEMIVIPKGIEHKPRAESEVSIMLIEPAGTINTGNTENEFTRKDLKYI